MRKLLTIATLLITLATHAQDGGYYLLFPQTAAVPAYLDSTSPTNLIGWWRADTLVTLNGSNVSAWKSVVGGDNVLTNATTSEQPPFISGAYNGKPTIRFNNKAYYLPIQSGADIVNILVSSTLGNALTVFLVGKNAVNDDGNLFGTYNGGGWMIYGNANRVYATGLNAGTTPQAPSITPVSSSLVLMAFTATPTQIVTYANGTQTGSVTGAGGSLYSGGNLNIGRYSANTTKGLTSYDVSEILVYNKVLTTSERLQVEAYLKYKYGL